MNVWMNINCGTSSILTLICTEHKLVLVLKEMYTVLFTIAKGHGSLGCI